jgi:hypothetical protein
MAGYISLRIHGGADGLTGRLAQLFDAEAFSPAAVGGLAPGQAGHRWFLAGLGLEDFVGRLLERRPRVPADVRLREGAGKREREYLEALRDRLDRLDSPISELSPFERADDRLRATALHGGSLDASVLDEADVWREGSAGAVVYLYGSVALAARGLERQPPLFRYLFPADEPQRSIGAPFLFMRAEGSVSGSPAVIDVYTSATVWLREGGGLNGHVGPEEADQNLDTLVGLARCLAAADDTESAHLRVEGAAFARERPRLEERFAPMVDSIEVG